MAARSRLGWVSSPVAALARGLGLIPHRQQVLHRAPGDRAQLVLLLGRGLELDGGVPDATVDAVLDLAGVKRAGHQAVAVPARAEALGDGAGGQRRR